MGDGNGLHISFCFSVFGCYKHDTTYTEDNYVMTTRLGTVTHQKYNKNFGPKKIQQAVLDPPKI
jgi:hypothetical protein